MKTPEDYKKCKLDNIKPIKNPTKKDKMEYAIEVAKDRAEGMFGGKYGNSGIQWMESSFPNSGKHEMKHMDKYKVFLMSHIENFHNPKNPNPRFPRNNPLLCCVVADYGNNGTVRIMPMITWYKLITYVDIYKRKYGCIEEKPDSKDDVYNFINVKGGRSFSELQENFGSGSGIIRTINNSCLWAGLEIIITHHIDHLLESRRLILACVAYRGNGCCCLDNQRYRVYTVENLPDYGPDFKEEIDFLRSKGYIITP